MVGGVEGFYQVYEECPRQKVVLAALFEACFDAEEAVLAPSAWLGPKLIFESFGLYDLD